MCKRAFCAVAALIAGAAWGETAAFGTIALEGWSGPPAYNIRVFTDTWYGYGPYYGGLHMADMKN